MQAGCCRAPPRDGLRFSLYFDRLTPQRPSPGSGFLSDLAGWPASAHVLEKQRCTHRPPKILKSVRPTRSGGLPCSNFRILNREQGRPQNRTGAHDLCISRWIGRWIGMDRRGACFCEFALAPMTCAFLPMDRRMDRDGSGWIVRSGLL